MSWLKNIVDNIVHGVKHDTVYDSTTFFMVSRKPLFSMGNTTSLKSCNIVHRMWDSIVHTMLCIPFIACSLILFTACKLHVYIMLYCMPTTCSTTFIACTTMLFMTCDATLMSCSTRFFMLVNNHEKVVCCYTCIANKHQITCAVSESRHFKIIFLYIYSILLYCTCCMYCRFKFVHYIPIYFLKKIVLILNFIFNLFQKLINFLCEVYGN